MHSRQKQIDTDRRHFAWEYHKMFFTCYSVNSLQLPTTRVAESEDYDPTPTPTSSPEISKMPTPTPTPDSDSDSNSRLRLRLPSMGKVFILN